MSRSRILPSFSSSRQMMMAWKVRGLSQSPAIMASRPASMRLAMAISPSRDSSSTEPISRRYMRTGSSVRSAGSALASVLASAFWGTRARLSSSSAGSSPSAGFLGVVRLDDVDAHVRQHGHDVLDLVGGIFHRRQEGVELVEGDVALGLGRLQKLLHRLIGKIEKRAVALGRLGRLFLVFRFLRRLRCACHRYPYVSFEGSALDDRDGTQFIHPRAG